MSFVFATCTVGPAGKPCHGGDDAGNECTGVVHFRQPADGKGACEITYDISGLTPGLHGFHIHEKADFSNGCASAGGHWNPHGKNHGDVSDAPECHAGDLGNIVADEAGRAAWTVKSDLIHLTGDLTVVGRSVMVHADPDDLGKGDCSEPGVNGKTSHTTGNAGARVACGEIISVAEDPVAAPEAAASAGGAKASVPAVAVSASCVVGPAGKPCHGGDDAGNQCSGVVTFTQLGDNGPTRVAYDITGLTPGLHGFHIHEKADFSQGCASAGGHWNPHGKNHGDVTDAPECHAGDLGNIVAGEDGRAAGIIVAPLLRLAGDLSIVGRSVMVHADPDDLGKGDCSEPGVNGKTSHTTGNAGARVACGAIVASAIRATSVVGPAGKPCHGGDDTGNECNGVVTLTQSAPGAPVEVAYDISGLTPGLHGFHIHEKADFSNGCASAGGHWNPHGKNHGNVTDAPECHAGDLGNIVADAAGRAVGIVASPLLELSGELSVVGRSMMVHADPDDLGKGDCSEPGVNGKTSHTTGNAGARVACGAIVLAGSPAPTL